MPDSTFFLTSAETVTVNETVLPVDSAFLGGQKHLDSFESVEYKDIKTDDNSGSSAVIDILTMIFVILGIASLRKFINLVPSLVGCIIRWKENINLEDSTKLCLSRNSLFSLLLIPFCIIAEKLRIYDPYFISGLTESYHFLAIAGIFLFYLLLRKFLNRFVHFGKISKKNFDTAINSFRTYFVITVTIILITSGISDLANIPYFFTKNIVIYEILGIYSLFLLRKTQIFVNSCSLISGILYLCTLEILPTGILIASAIVL